MTEQKSAIQELREVLNGPMNHPLNHPSDCYQIFAEPGKGPCVCSIGRARQLAEQVEQQMFSLQTNHDDLGKWFESHKTDAAELTAQAEEIERLENSITRLEHEKDGIHDQIEQMEEVEQGRHRQIARWVDEKAAQAEEIERLREDRERLGKQVLELERLSRASARVAYGQCQCCPKCGPTIPCITWCESEAEECDGACFCEARRGEGGEG